MNFTRPISKLLDEVKKAYIEDQEAKGIRASGKSAKSLRKHPKPTSGTLTGAKYFFQQRHGRRPGKFPPIDDILNWIRAKGIQPGMYQPTPKTGQKIPKPRQMTERQLAFLFAQKIAERGTDVYLGKRPGLNPDAKVEASVTAMGVAIGKELKKHFKTTIA